MGAFFSEPNTETSTQAIAETNTVNQFVTFTCGQRAFGIDIMSVREIRSWSPTTPMPNQPYGAQGVLDIRGSIVEVYDLAAMLGAMADEADSGKVILVASLGHRDVGIIADTVSDIIFAKAEDMRPAPSKPGAKGESMVSMLVKTEERLIAILDLKALFPGYEFQ